MKSTAARERENDMCTRSVPCRAVRKLSLSFPVQIGRRGSEIALAITLCVIVLLCVFEPSEAASAAWTQVDVEDNEAILFAPEAPPSAIPTDRLNPQPKRVKCLYFKTWPLRTYCHVLGLTGVITAQVADEECRAISMDIISLNTTPMHRLCTLMKHFGLEERKLWLADVFDRSDTLTWDECNIEVLAANVTKPPSNCTICNIAVVCDAGFYHSNGSNCIVMEHGNEEVEYCYHDDKLSALESRQSCLSQPSPLSMLMDGRLLNDSQVDYIRRLVRTDLKFWVDLKQEDVGQLSGVVAFDAYAIDWNTSCFTVWFGRDVPWFFKTSCDELYPVVCEDSTKRGRGMNYQFSDCIYHKSQSWMFDYCVPEGRAFSMTAAAKFCVNHAMSLLNGKTLHELFFVYTRIDKQPSSVTDNFLVWDARGSLGGYNQPFHKCQALGIRGSSFVPVLRSCSEKLGYICRQKKLPEAHGFNCANVSRFQKNRPPTCINYLKMTYEESLQACKALGMNLLPDNLVVDAYENLLGSYEGYEGTAYWLNSPESCRKSCTALVRNETTVILYGIDCATKFRSMCVFNTPTTTAISAPTAMLPNTDRTTPRPTTGTTIFSPSECPTMDGWPLTKVGGKATKRCQENYIGDIFRTCENNGHWSKDEDSSYCKTPNLWHVENNVKNSTNIQEVIYALGNFTRHVHDDGYIRSVYSALSSVMKKLEMLLNNTPETERASQTQQLATTVVDLASATMQKPHIWSIIPESERLDTAAGLAHRVESIFIKMIMHQYPNLTETKFGNENLIMEVKLVTQESLKNTTVLSSGPGATVVLPPHFLSGGPSNAVVIFSENTLVNDIFKTMSPSASSKYPILATSFVSASIVSNDQRTSKINGNVTLFFKYNNALKKLTPKCSFIEVNANGSSEWSTEGCTLVRITENEVECSCNHLTVFAVIMSGKNIVDVDDIIRLEWITKIGCGISIVCLATCIVIFSVYRQLRGIRNTIHRNLCLSLLIAEIILLAGMQRVPNDWVPPEPPVPVIPVPLSCTVVAFLLHFFFLSAFGWMALEGCHIIVLLWKVFNQKRTYYERYYFAGYGIPLIIASITLGCRYDLYANRRADDRFCWIPEEKGVRYSFIGPVAAVILLNVGALCLVLWKMSHVRLVVEKSTAEKVKNWVRGTFILLPILGVTWLFGFLMLGDKDLHRVGAYLFTIFNCLQGLGIFVCHVFMSKKTREAIFRSVVNTGSILKGSMSSRPSGSGTSSTKTTWYPISLSSNSTSHSSSSSNGIPSNDAEQPSQSFNSEASSWTPLQWLPGTRFRYNLRLNQDDTGPLRSTARLGSGDQQGQPTVVKFRWARSIAS
ncbi:uncharacterized protein LOC119178622 isoform X3 [Rhipicephalus microplus]|uniref:uncharacterized protein LOC119178622 isoform X3 n=1 Tax=Rhipicephalus microplus TaxID=6941 RepID=UPI003F6C1083